MAYFDNAATTFPKPEAVYTTMDKFYRECGGSYGRGNYDNYGNVHNIVDDTRLQLLSLLHCPAKKVVFTPTATIAINIIIQGIILNGVKNVYISPFEHNAVTRTLFHFERQGIIKVIELSVDKETLQYDLSKIKYQFEAIKPDFVIVSHASNVIGLVAPVAEIFSLSKHYDAITLVDMAQTAGLIDLNVGLESTDFAVFAGHKTLMGPTGISGFIMKPALKLQSVIFGGTGFESANQNMPDSIPERYEMGTLNISGIAGLNAAVKWIQNETIRKIKKSEENNRERIISLLKKYEFISIIGNNDMSNYVGIVSCLINGISSDSAGNVLAERNIFVRTGLHCAPGAHKFIGTYPAGTVRFSVNCMTDDNDFKQLENALADIEEEL